MGAGNIFLRLHRGLGSGERERGGVLLIISLLSTLLFFQRVYGEEMVPNPLPTGLSPPFTAIGFPFSHEAWVTTVRAFTVQTSCLDWRCSRGGVGGNQTNQVVRRMQTKRFCAFSRLCLGRRPGQAANGALYWISTVAGAFPMDLRRKTEIGRMPEFSFHLKCP